MKTMKAEYETGLARIAEDMAKRDRDNLRWFLGIGLAIMVLLAGIFVKLFVG